MRHLDSFNLWLFTVSGFIVWLYFTITWIARDGINNGFMIYVLGFIWIVCVSELLGRKKERRQASDDVEAWNTRANQHTTER